MKTALVVITLAAFTGLGQPCPAARAQAAKPAPFRFAGVNDGSLGLWEGDRPVLVYHHKPRSPEGVPAARPRSAYIHPLYGLDGEILTDDAPADHLHHRGLFWAWPHVTVDGQHYDMWLQKGIEQKFERWLLRESGPDCAVLGVENGWIIGTKKVMREQLTLRVHRATILGRAIDLDLMWTPLDQPVTLGGAEGKSYGGLTCRFAPGEETLITVPSGPTEDDLYMARLPWADLTRLLQRRREPSGAAILVHPTHPDYPPTWLTRHYGALCVGWPGVRPQALEAGKPVECRFRVWIHRGRIDVDQLRKAHAAYVAEAGETRGAVSRH
jgi:hypothetical protein